MDPTTLEVCRSLIGFDTVSRNSNLGLIEWMRDYLASLGVRSHLSHDAGGAKANLFATVGDAPGPGLVLCGHTDVVPVDGQDWTSDPFRAEQRAGRLYGRGSADMKGFIACVLAAVPRMLVAPLARPLHMAFTYDEEVGCRGAPLLLREAQSRGVAMSGCIVGEPTGMRVMNGHKGIRVYRCRVFGREAHSSLPDRGVNAIEYAARMIGMVRELAEELARAGPRDDSFEIPHATLQTCLVSGGTAANIVPRECSFAFDLRYLPGMDPETVETRIRRDAMEVLGTEMRRRAPETGIELVLEHEAPALDTPDDDRLTYLGTRLACSSILGRVPFATDGGHFSHAGIPTIVIGPGSIEQAHKPDEFVELAQLDACDAFLERLIAAESAS